LGERETASRSELARVLAVESRYVTADLNDLEAAGRVESVGERRNRRWRLVRRDATPTAPAGLLDRVAVRLGRELLVFLDGTVFGEAFEKLDDPALRADLDRKFIHRQEPARSYGAQSDLLDEVLNALIKCRWLSIRYKGSDGRERAHEARPMTLVVYRRALYLLALDDREEVLRLAVERILAVRPGEPFEYPASWDPEAELEPYFGIHKRGAVERVVMRFAASKAELVRSRTWHPTAKLMELPDGRIELVMRAGGAELVRFALEWGPYCEVVGPKWLRDEVVRELRTALEQYLEDGVLDV
jgi:predicted DNA-binding transcriptional regulator YafY